MRIDWSERAVTRFDKAVGYGRVAFGIKAAQRFYQRWVSHVEGALSGGHYTLHTKQATNKLLTYKN